MISQSVFESCVMRAALAPNVHNTQPARWARDGDVLSLFCDTDVGLTIGDPTGRDAALSCGAVLEAMVMALSAHGLGATVAYTGQSTEPDQGVVRVADITMTAGEGEDVLHPQLEQRFTWRGAFKSEPAALFGWTHSDVRLITDQTSKEWVADQNDWASHQIMQNRSFRDELLSWMRLYDSHPRVGFDGMNRASMNMGVGEARVAPFVLTKLWRMMHMFGMTKRVTSERSVTVATPVIALFHRDIHEDPVVSGRAYLRMCLEATSLGFAGWPMAALTDHPTAHEATNKRFGITPDRRLIQAIRFGKPEGVAPRRARRPLDEILI